MAQITVVIMKSLKFSLFQKTGRWSLHTKVVFAYKDNRSFIAGAYHILGGNVAGIPKVKEDFQIRKGVFQKLSRITISRHCQDL